jgi:outer membrane biosynthesis protein TonB
VILEVTVDPSGVPARVGLLRSTPPYSQMVIDAVSRWRFAPARSRTPDGDVAVQSSVIVTAVYRPPVLTNGPTLGETPKDVARGSGESPYPVGIVEPNYPPRAFTGGVIAYEVVLDEIGRIQNLRIVGEDPGFDAVAREALLQWKFRGGSVRGRPAPTSAYVIFAFSMPVVGAPGLQPQPRPAPK